MLTAYDFTGDTLCHSLKNILSPHYPEKSIDIGIYYRRRFKDVLKISPLSLLPFPVVFKTFFKSDKHPSLKVTWLSYGCYG